MSRTLAAEQIKEGRPEADQIKADADLAKKLNKDEVKTGHKPRLGWD